MSPTARATRVDVDLGAIAANVALLRGRLGGAALCAVVKGDAYGHGMLPVARAALAAGATWLAVAWLDDALALRAAGIEAPILLLGGDLRTPAVAAAVVAHRLTPSLSNAAEVALLAAAAPPSGLAVHVEVDTGMARLGVALDDLPALLTAVARAPNLRLTGLMSHYAAADLPHHPMTEQQAARWQRARAAAAAAGLSLSWQHSAHSAAGLSLPLGSDNLVRTGLALYGLDPLAVPIRAGLRPALSWHTEVVGLRTVPAGTPVSYHGRWTSRRPSRIATLPVGYADGYPRLMTGRAEVLVAGRRAPVVGVICMDMCMVDVTEVPEAAVGSPVVLLGTQSAAAIGAAELAAWAETISYEILTGISPRLPRRHLP